MTGAVFRRSFIGYSTTFRQNRRPVPEKSDGAAATNTAGKNAPLRGRNKAERNCRRTQGVQWIKSRRFCTKNTVRQFPFFGVGTKKNVAFLFMIIAFLKSASGKSTKNFMKVSA